MSTKPGLNRVASPARTRPAPRPSPSRRRRDCRGYTLVEVLVMMPIAVLCLAALTGVSMFASRTFNALINYTDLGHQNRYAADLLQQEIRQATRVSAATTNSLTLIDGSGVTVSYVFDASTGRLTRTRNGTSKVILTGCDTLRFDLGERPVGGSYEVYPAASADTAKVVDLSWTCSRTILGVKQNTASVQTARVVIRKQGT